MAVYVDSAEFLFGRSRMCHMMADTLEELHSMAEHIGMKREWFQPLSRPHCDVSKSRRKLAVAAGAVEVGPAEMAKISRKWAQRLADAT